MKNYFEIWLVIMFVGFFVGAVPGALVIGICYWLVIGYIEFEDWFHRFKRTKREIETREPPDENLDPSNPTRN